MQTIGVLGGMGTYATIHLFQQYAAIFPAEKEWDRPRILIDNRCTMPSRVRAFLYGEQESLLIHEMTDSIEALINAGATRIILACNTSHLFLPKICELLPSAQGYMENIIEHCVSRLAAAHVSDVYLLASEGTITSQIYQNYLSKIGICCHTPNESEFGLLRECIEAVKQNQYSEHIREIFLELINRSNNCILGCTELPILFEKYADGVLCENVYDPIRITLEDIKGDFTK